MNPDNTFSIAAKTCTLKHNSQEGHSTIFNSGVKYVIPIYQRPYSWKEEQIAKFLGDLLTSFWGVDGNSSEEPMFIGTMQLSANNGSGKQDIIDGQQRLTTFLILLKVLKSEFPDCGELADMDFDWLSTQVSKPTQQYYLDAFIAADLKASGDSQNPYFRNAMLMKNILMDEKTNFSNIDIDKFTKHLLSNVYFVVIETRAGLSKTLQIFNAINTTGLDLNGGDIFKIRMYEYLTDKKGQDESAFERINHLYHKIDDYNSKLNADIININEVLRIYQYILVARHGLPTTLYYQGVETFYEGLFDTVFNINHWDHFKNNISTLELSLEDLEQIIDVRYAWEKQWRSKEGFTAEDACAMHFIWSSRYTRYWNLVLVYLHKYRGTENESDNLLLFIRQLSKVFTIYSIRYQKIKSDIFYGFMHKVIDALVNKPFEETMAIINSKIGKEKDHNPGGWYDLNHFLSERLTDNPRRKGIICRLSAMLEEDYKSTQKEQINAIRKRLFESKIDIEHIQSYHDSNGELRQEIWDEWKHNINSLGNLMVLEQSINRSISNKPYEVKIQGYPTSSFSIVKNHSTLYGEWGLDKCLERKEKEKNKILNYLFN
ncbi:hypothetical protein TH61_16350 [Rufibacter sp. DG15C]|uniref:DUF262 domain-containing protein n=1 Tax=Rufibacter sp. DG15C TaxID=1379909 RepID=UPI00078D994E|nr:DUF262 domain-containing protein [Rufibacter sp. DG15C]AMM52444.1 hypothetical protein TH61_16350 [Rufibacter sp. DG15C]